MNSLHRMRAPGLFPACQTIQLRVYRPSLGFKGSVQRGATKGVEVQAGKHVFALDFDGVICDSVYESSISAWKAATKLWPDTFNTDDAQQKKDKVLEGMRIVRPVVETGYENIAQVRLLLEGTSPQEMLGAWPQMLPVAMEELGVERSALVQLFGSTRGEWMSEDLQGWLNLNRIYPGVADSIRAAMDSSEVYIVTTKQAQFTDALLKNMAGIEFPFDRIYSMTVSGRPKSEVLSQLMLAHPDSSYHFVEDKMGTLLKVCQDAALSDWQLYLVDWGYNTQQERDAAENHPRIKLINARQFDALMSQGSTICVEG